MSRFRYALLTLLIIGALLMSCAPAATPEPQVIKETVIVKETVAPQTVKETVVVEETVVVKETVEVPVEVPVEVTPTPVPPPIKQGGPVFLGSGGMTGRHFNPIWLTSNPQFWAFPLILPALTWFDAQVQPVPHLATDIEVNADATEYIFHLPENAEWSDGEPLTAEDVKFTYELALNPVHVNPSWTQTFVSVVGVDEYRNGEADSVEGIQIVDDYTVRFELKAPNAEFLRNTYLGILPEHVLGDVPPEEYDTHPYMDAPTVTSGPFDFVEYVPEQYIHLKAKRGYWGQEANIDEVYITLLDSSATILAQLEAGELDLAEIPAEERARFETIEHVNILPVKGIGYYVTHIDFRNQEQIDTIVEGGSWGDFTKEIKPYLQEKSFRQALAYAIDTNAVIQVVADGQGTPIYSSIFGPDWAINPNLNTYERDLDMAKSLMEEAGVTFDEDGKALWDGEQIRLTYLSNTSEEARKFGEVLQQQLGEAGIRLDIQLVTSSAFLTAAIQGEGDLVRNAGGRFGADPSVTSLYYTCKAGWASLVIGYCNPDFDDLMTQGVAVSDLDARQEIYWEASAILNDELPSLFFYTPNRFFGVNKGLKGVVPSSDPGYVTWNILDWYFE
jgi:peptide/nickel transport system substrate-binding protein